MQASSSSEKTVDMYLYNGKAKITLNGRSHEEWKNLDFVIYLSINMCFYSGFPSTKIKSI